MSTSNPTPAQPCDHPTLLRVPTWYCNEPDEHVLPLPADAYEAALSAERGWWQVVVRATGERVYHGIGPVEIVVSAAPF